MTWTRLDSATVGVGVLIAVVCFPLFFSGFAGFWDNLTEYSGGKLLSLGQCKVMFWLLIAAGGAVSARYNLHHWFPHFFR